MKRNFKNADIYLFNINTGECKKPIFRNTFEYEKYKHFDVYDDENNIEEAIMLDYKTFKSFYKSKNVILFYEFTPVEL